MVAQRGRCLRNAANTSEIFGSMRIKGADRCRIRSRSPRAYCRYHPKESRVAPLLPVLPCAGARFAAASQVESLAHPLGDRHAAGASHSLNFAVLVILKNYLQPLAHSDESIRLKAQTLSSLSFGSMIKPETDPPSQSEREPAQCLFQFAFVAPHGARRAWCGKRTVSHKKR
jgi:hypothetical protein